MLGLAAVYFIAARLGLLLVLPGGHVAPLWPPAGIALGAILLRGSRVWPGIWLGSVATNLVTYYGGPLGGATSLFAAAMFAAGASAAAALGGLLVRRFIGDRDPLARVADVCAFILLGGVVSSLFSASVGATLLGLTGLTLWAEFGRTWLTWWLGDAAGVIIVAPLLLVWRGGWRPPSLARWLELGACFGLLAASTYYAFIGSTSVLFSGNPWSFLMLPFVVWPAVRFGRRGAALAIALVAGIAVWGTIHHTGPFSFSSRTEALLLLQLFLSMVVLTGLGLAAVLIERAETEAAHRRALREMEKTVRERTAALERSEAQARGLLATADRARHALLSILEDERLSAAKLRESEARFRAIFEQAAVGVAQVAPDGRWLDVNQRLCDIVGYSRAELLRKTFQDITHPEDMELDLAYVCRILAGEIQTYAIEKRYLRGDHSVIWVRLTVSLVRGTDGEPLHFVSVVEEISARKQAEEALVASERRFRAIFEQAPLGIAEAETATGRFIDVNHRYAEIFGYTREEFMRLTFEDYTHSEDLEKNRAEVQKLAAGEISSFAMEKRSRRKDGSLIWTRLAVASLAPRGTKSLRSLAIIDDITQRKQAEEDLKAMSGQLRALAARVQLVREEERTAIAREIHDVLAQDLTKLKIDLVWLAKRLAQPPDPASRPAICGRIEDALTQIDTSISEVQRIATDLRPVILDTLGLFAAVEWLAEDFARRTGLKCRAEVARGTSALDRDCATAIFRILQESLTNVARHAQASEVVVRFSEKAGTATLSVSDNGVGITRDRLEDPRSIGLLGMRERAHVFGGSVEISGTPRSGTQVVVRLPIKPAGEP